jgi:putative ABC transport system permease protein
VEFVRNISQIRVMRAASWVVSVIAVAIGVVGVLNTMITSVFERASEIGTLRAIGWRKRRVMSMVFLEALLLSVLAAIVGGALGAGTVRLLGCLPQLAGFVDGWPPAAVFAQGALLAVVVGILGAVYPAVWAANLWPVQALRRH